MPRIVVHTMPKTEILDPQGQAIGAALARANYQELSHVRQGKRFEFTLTEPITETTLSRVREAAQALLTNPVIDDIVDIEVLENGH